MNALTKRFVAMGASSIIAVSAGYLVAPFEGTKKNSNGENVAYIDMVGIPTVCYGFTHGVKMGDKHSDEYCDKQLVEELTKFNTQMKKNVKVPLKEHEEIAYTSFVWNVGIGAWNSSTLLKKLNAGDREGACKQLLVWNKATFNKKGADNQIKSGQTCTPSAKQAGMYSCTVKGLTNRRTEEFKVCTNNNSDVANALKEISLMQIEGDEGVVGAVNSVETIILDEGSLPHYLEEINDSSPQSNTPSPIPEASKDSSSSCIKKWWLFCLQKG